MSRNPYDTVGISLILLVDETQNEKADGRQRTNLNTLVLAGRPLAPHREAAYYYIYEAGAGVKGEKNILLLIRHLGVKLETIRRVPVRDIRSLGQEQFFETSAAGILDSDPRFKLRSIIYASSDCP